MSWLASKADPEAQASQIFGILALVCAALSLVDAAVISISHRFFPHLFGLIFGLIAVIIGMVLWVDMALKREPSLVGRQCTIFGAIGVIANTILFFVFGDDLGYALTGGV